MDYINKLYELDKLIKDGVVDSSSHAFNTGVDLGTANVLLVVTDKDKNPIAGKIYPSRVVKDGIVVDYIGAINMVKQMKIEIEEMLGYELVNASCAIPPNVNKGSVRTIQNIIEASGFELNKIVDEPEAAANVLDIKNGAVVDLGGGTTGISIVNNGRVIYSDDEPTGGIHMSLSLAGYYNISLEKAENIKKSGKDDVFFIIKPILEKMALIVKNIIKDYKVECLYLVGGSSNFKGIEGVFSNITNVKTKKIDNAILVTPYGISIS